MKRKHLNDPASIEAQERLVEIMNDSSRKVLLGGTEWEITALKPGTQWLIAQEACKILKAESANYSDVIRQFAVNVPSVVSVLTLALLNDREKIFKGGDTHAGFSDLYSTTYDTILWNTDQSEWIKLLVEVIQLIDVEVFFSTTASIQILRQRTLERKMTMEEQRLLLQEQSSAR